MTTAHTAAQRLGRSDAWGGSVRGPPLAAQLPRGFDGGRAHLGHRVRVQRTANQKVDSPMDFTLGLPDTAAGTGLD